MTLTSGLIVGLVEVPFWTLNSPMKKAADRVSNCGAIFYHLQEGENQSHEP